MRMIFGLALFGAAIYGVYRWIEYESGNAITRTAKEMSGGQLERAQRTVNRARENMAGASRQFVKDAIRMFKVEYKRNPESLDELVDTGYLNSVPTGVEYDSETGEVTASE